MRPEFPLPFADDTQRTPDVVVYRWPLQHPRDDRRNLVGPADVGLLVEVVKPLIDTTYRTKSQAEFTGEPLTLAWLLIVPMQIV